MMWTRIPTPPCAAPQHVVALAARPFPRASVRCSAHSHNLEPWQQAMLEEAYAQGRRKIKVNDLSKEVGLNRQVVLQWFKDQDALPEEVRASLYGARMAALQADRERAALLSAAEAEQQEVVVDEEALLPPAERQKAFYARKRLAWDVEATFTKVYAAHHGRPSDDMVRSLAELHRLPRRRVIDWFTAKRAEEFEARKQRRGSGKHRGPDQQRQPRQDTPTRGQQRE